MPHLVGEVSVGRDDVDLGLELLEFGVVVGSVLDFSRVEPAFPEWSEYTRGWAARAARGTGVRGGPEGTRTTYFYNTAFAPFGRGWGGSFAPTAVCEPLPPPVCDPPPLFPPIITLPGQPTPEPTPCVTPSPTEPPNQPPGNPNPGPPTKPPKPRRAPPGRRRLRA